MIIQGQFDTVQTLQRALIFQTISRSGIIFCRFLQQTGSKEYLHLLYFCLGVSSGDSEINSGGVDFKGEVSELNIWGSTLSQNQMKEITEKCGKAYPIPDTLSWSDVDATMLSTKNNYKKDITHLCLPGHGKVAPMFYTIMPYLQNQDNAIYTCNILNAKLAFPKTLDEHHTWNGKTTIRLLLSELTYK